MPPFVDARAFRRNRSRAAVLDRHRPSSAGLLPGPEDCLSLFYSLLYCCAPQSIILSSRFAPSSLPPSCVCGIAITLLRCLERSAAFKTYRLTPIIKWLHISPAHLVPVRPRTIHNQPGEWSRCPSAIGFFRFLIKYIICIRFEQLQFERSRIGVHKLPGKLFNILQKTFVHWFLVKKNIIINLNKTY